MRICQTHWDKLRSLIEKEGLSRFVAKDGAEAMVNSLKEFNNEFTNPDPLMMANNMLTSKALDMFGWEMLVGEICPVCHTNQNVPDVEEQQAGEFLIETLIPCIKEEFEIKGFLNLN